MQVLYHYREHNDNVIFATYTYRKYDPTFIANWDESLL